MYYPLTCNNAPSHQQLTFLFLTNVTGLEPLLHNRYSHSYQLLSGYYKNRID